MKPSLSQLKRLVGNPDAYAIQQDDGSYRPIRKTDGGTGEPIHWHNALKAHLAGGWTIGTYVNTGDKAHTLVFDIDSDTTSIEEADRIVSALSDLGIPEYAWGREFSGRKGYHVWVLVAGDVPAGELRRLGRAAVAMAEVTCEVFPKQDSVRDLGNLVKLPGGVHRVTGNRTEFIDRVPRPMPVAVFERILASLPAEQSARRTSSETRFPCMEVIQEEGASEGGRNIQLFHLATLLRRGGVGDSFVELIIRSVNERCSPPLDNSELYTLIESSKTSGPLCNLLPEERQCGELCIRERTKGLYARPGQLRHAADGESVVVTVKSRTARYVTLEHDDLGETKGWFRRVGWFRHA